MNFQVMLLLVCEPHIGKECPSTTEERKGIGSDGERRKRTKRRERTGRGRRRRDDGEMQRMRGECGKEKD